MRNLLCTAALLGIVFHGYADEILLKSGKVVAISHPSRVGNSLMTDIAGMTGQQIGYSVKDIAKMVFPEPGQIKAASDLLSLEQPQQAITLLDPVLSFYGPFSDIPGNWWLPAALIKATALSALHRESEAEPLLKEIARLATDRNDGRLAKIRLAALSAQHGTYKDALLIYDEAVDNSFRADVLAEAWLDKGDALLASKQADAAEIAFLHIPVFFTDRCFPCHARSMEAGERSPQWATTRGRRRHFNNYRPISRRRMSLNSRVATWKRSKPGRRKSIRCAISSNFVLFRV